MIIIKNMVFIWLFAFIMTYDLEMSAV